MLRLALNQLAKIALWGILIVLSACTSFRPPPNTSTLTERLSKEIKVDLSTVQNDVLIQPFPLFDEEIAKENLGISPKETGMLPVYIKVENKSPNPIKVNLSNSFISVAEGKCPSINIEEAIARAIKSDAQVVGWTLLFGIPGMLISGSAAAEENKNIEEYYQRRSFKPTLLNSNTSGAGLVFFDIQKDKIDGEEFIIAISIKDLQTDSEAAIKIPFKSKDVRISERKSK